MAPMQRCLLLVILAGVAPSSAAVEIVRCTSADGEVRYQDRPCAAGEAVKTIRLDDDPPSPAAAAVEAQAAATPALDAAPAALGPARSAMPPAWLCRRDDGSRYLSETGTGERRAVPLAMLGVPSRGLADAYGPGGAGVSAPGLARPGIDRSPAAQLGAAHVWVEDPCAPASGADVCRFLEDGIVAAEKRLRYAFSDTAAQVRDDIASLRERAAPCR